MIYLGNGEIQNIYLGNAPIQGIYAGDLLIYPTTVTAWSVSPEEIEIEASGGTENIRITSLSAWTITSSESWITFSQNSGDSGRTSVVVTFGENETGAERAGTITATDGTNTSTVSVVQYACNPIVCADHLGNTNNQGKTINSNFYLFDSGVTAVTPCEYDFTGIKSICHRWDGFYQQTPAVSLGNLYNSNPSSAVGCLDTIQVFEADCTTVKVINYPFGNDRATNVAQNLTSVTFNNTDNVTYIGNCFYYNTNLVSVKFGSLSGIAGTPTYSSDTVLFNSANTAVTNFEVSALPNIDIDTKWGFKYCTALTVTSLVNILNALPVASGSRTITIGTTNKNKLSAAQLAIATNKGWTVN